jgi:hypothetical protein
MPGNLPPTNLLSLFRDRLGGLRAEPHELFADTLCRRRQFNGLALGEFSCYPSSIKSCDMLVSRHPFPWSNFQGRRSCLVGPPPRLHPSASPPPLLRAGQVLRGIGTRGQGFVVGNTDLLPISNSSSRAPDGAKAIPTMPGLA